MARAVILNSGRRKRRRRSDHADDYVNEAFRLRCPPPPTNDCAVNLLARVILPFTVNVCRLSVNKDVDSPCFFCYNLSPFVTGRPKKRKRKTGCDFSCRLDGHGHSVSGKRMDRVQGGLVDVQRKESRTYLLFIIQPPKKAF